MAKYSDLYAYTAFVLRIALPEGNFCSSSLNRNEGSERDSKLERPQFGHKP